MNTIHLHSLSFLQLGPFDLTVEADQRCFVFGQSGQGKTLLLKAIADIIPHRGQVYLGNIESQTLPAPEWRKKVGLLLADSQWWLETVGEHFWTVEESQFSALGFEKTVLNWQVNRLSSGEKQRLALLRILQNQPLALLLDEPSANLDSENTANMENLIQQYQSHTHIPILWVSHDSAQIERLADKCFLLYQNRLIEK
jgi:ABC-type iron transport system FetAB ATPase subunit